MEEKEQRSCHKCKTPYCVGEFKKVAGLQTSGLLIYVHKNTESSEQKSQVKKKKDESFILHNASDRELKRPDYIKEMCQYRTKCCQCKAMIQRVRSLLDEITDIRKNEVVGVCEYCKHLNPTGKCRRCEYLVNKFVCCKAKQQQEKQERFNSWLYKVNALLRSILECENIYKQKMYKESSSMDELEKLLLELKSPLTQRQPEICYFPTSDRGQFMSMESLSHSKEMLEELLVKIKQRSMEALPQDVTEIEKRKSEGSLKHSLELLPQNVQKIEKTKKNEKHSRKVLKIDNKTPDIERIKKTKTSRSTPELMKKLINKQLLAKEKTKEKNKKPMIDINDVIESYEKRHEIIPSVEVSESFIECENPLDGPREMIKGTAVVPFDPNYKDEPSPDVVPLLYRVEAILQNIDSISIPSTSSLPKTKIENSVSQTKSEKSLKSKSSLKQNHYGTGIIQYKLSNPEFIEKGWTILPTEKIMRKINIYKMEPACPQFDWFENHKNKKMYYDSGEYLAEIGDDGNGKWFYRNGAVALDFYNAEELNTGHRYIVYSSGDDIDKGKAAPHTVLAIFDYRGNGVVYDKYGNERLKYNQSEGIIYDKKIGPPSRWQWHSLNEPPELQKVFVENYAKEPFLEKQSRRDITNEEKVEETNSEMLVIEFENFVKAKAGKLLQKYKPFKIRMKALKINDQFSLRVLDQANIYLLFRDGHTTLKLNVGMVLINTEIIDTETADMSNVATPYDRFPAQSQSMENIQNTLQRARRIGEIRAERNRRLLNITPLSLKTI